MKIEELQTYQGIVESLKKKGRTKHLLPATDSVWFMMPKYSRIMLLVPLLKIER